MKISEIREKNDLELSEMLDNFKKESFNLRFQKISNKLTNTSRVGQVKKLIAKVKTVIVERKMQINGAKKNA
jgi:large subunit ribosomal protein L29